MAKVVEASGIFLIDCVLLTTKSSEVMVFENSVNSSSKHKGEPLFPGGSQPYKLATIEF